MSGGCCAALRLPDLHVCGPCWRQIHWDSSITSIAEIVALFATGSKVRLSLHCAVGFIYARLKGKRVRFLTDAQTTNGNSLAFFTDPDGNILHLLHRETPLP